ncbi:hypothetical protein [Quatrionicoccus australiensis]|uniref:hypothetical protein n=1 Tax=Quatrionicoccus australiensis TaxID=138118 RepID=UPI001CF941ED|nr:hypothetical protein [Quatrionicoccus australiensis]MCB4358467.1 hypothetical protein [Quatrionicoccus australiensis]
MMVGSLNLHGIVGVHLDSIDHGTTDYGDHYSRSIVFEAINAAGSKQEFRVNLFSDNGHNLLVSDAELDAILLEPVREAA